MSISFNVELKGEDVAYKRLGKQWLSRIPLNPMRCPDNTDYGNSANAGRPTNQHLEASICMYFGRKFLAP